MELLIPETGLLFWMLVAFGIVFFILAKFGFPVITKMITDRKAFIDNSMESAREANEQLAGIKAQGEAILSESRRERNEILAQAAETKKQIVAQARDEAAREARIQMDKAKEEIAKAKELALRDIRSEIAALSLQMAEKVVREKLDNPEEQTKIINRMLDDVTIYKS